MTDESPKAASPTIAGVVTVLTMTDGTCRVYEADGDASSTASPVYCDGPDAALDYMRDTDALHVNPALYR